MMTKSTFLCEIFLVKKRTEEYYITDDFKATALSYTQAKAIIMNHIKLFFYPRAKQSFMMQQCDSDRSPLEPFYVSPAKLARLVGLHYFSCQKRFFNYTLTFCSIIIAVCESLTADCLPSGSPTQFCVPVKYFLARLSSVSNLLSSQVICQDNISRLMWCPLIICNNWE